MQIKVNVLDDQPVGARITEAHIAEFEALADGPRRRNGVRLRPNRGLHLEKLKQVLEENRLFGNIVEIAENTGNIRARPRERTSEESEGTDGDSACQRLRQHHHISAI